MSCPICGRRFGSPRAVYGHQRWSPDCRLTDVELLDLYVPTRPLGKCWLWTGPVVPSGWDRWTYYGCVWRDGVKQKAHRWVWERFGPGPIPDGHELDHTCETTLCVQPRCMASLDSDDHRAVTEARRSARRIAALGTAAHLTDAEVDLLVSF